VVELAGDYSTERSARFVNGVVSGIAAELRGGS
jgi:transcription termination factor NusB